MEDMLAVNIRTFRKQRRMTQEQLAEALGMLEEGNPVLRQYR